MEDKDSSEKIQQNNAEGTNESGKDRHSGAKGKYTRMNYPWP